MYVETLPGDVVSVWYSASPPNGLEPGWYGCVINRHGPSCHTGRQPTEGAAWAEIDRQYREWLALRT